MGAEEGRLPFGAIILVFALLPAFLPTVNAAPVTRATNNTITWNMASHAILSTFSYTGDRFPFAGLRFLGTNQQVFNDGPSPGTYTYSSKYI
jgi:hypothetical protein